MADTNAVNFEDFKKKLNDAVSSVFFEFNGKKGCSYGKADLDKAMEKFFEGGIEEYELAEVTCTDMQDNGDGTIYASFDGDLMLNGAARDFSFTADLAVEDGAITLVDGSLNLDSTDRFVEELWDDFDFQDDLIAEIESADYDWDKIDSILG